MGVFGVFAAIVTMAAGLFAIDQPGPSRSDTTYLVERGASFGSVARDLEAQGVIDNAALLSRTARLLELSDDLKAGEYSIPARASMRDVIGIVTSGRAVNRSVTIPEGWTVWQAVQRLNLAEGLEGEITQLPPEGELLPDTYFYQLGEGRQDVLDRMLAAQDSVFETLWVSRSDDLPYANQQEALIMASIIERETGQTAERDVVASVYVNRLRRGMRLQADPTVIYGVTGGQQPLRRGLLRSELDDASNLYNTYRHNGLPPGPIANPGAAAIEAALNPAETDYIFFVVDCDGGHAFTTNYDDHLAAVADFRQCEAAWRAPSPSPARPQERPPHVVYPDLPSDTQSDTQ